MLSPATGHWDMSLHLVDAQEGAWLVNKLARKVLCDNTLSHTFTRTKPGGIIQRIIQPRLVAGIGSPVTRLTLEKG
jgi:hypothetical protein